MRRNHPAFDRTAGLLAVLLLLAACLAGPASAQRRSYTIDEDPYRLGNKALAAGNLDEARSRYREAVANGHKLPEALCALARIDRREGHYAQAEANYRQSLAAGGGNYGPARAGLGLLLLRRERDAEAESEFRQALANDRDLWEAHYGLARLALAAGQWETAREHLDFGRKVRGRENGEDEYRYGEALYLLGTGDAAGAERAALRARSLAPDEPLYARLVARIYRDQGQRALAISAYEQAVATPGVADRASLLHELGGLYAEENRFNEASARYLQAVSADSTYAPALRDLADLFRRARQYDKAAGTYLRYVALEPEDKAVRLRLSESLCELGRFDEAAAAVRPAWRSSPDDRTAGFQFARAGIRANNDTLRTEAADLLAGFLAAGGSELPWQADELLALAAWRNDRQEYEPALDALAKAAELAPDDSRIPFRQGLVELSAGRPANAVAGFERAVELDPEAPANHLNLGIARYQAGQMQEAVPAFRRAVALRPDLTSARLLLAQVLAATASLSEAEQEYRGILDREPRNAKALRGLGFCRLRAADYSGAAEAYGLSTEADPANADGWAGLGSARLGLGDLSSAEAAFARAEAIDPQNIMLRTGTELLNQAKNSGKETESR